MANGTDTAYIPTEVNYISPKEFVLIIDLPLIARPLGRHSLKPFCGRRKSCGAKVLPPRERVSR